MNLILRVCSLVNFLFRSNLHLISKDFWGFLVNQRKLDLFGFWDCLNRTHFLVHVPRYCVFTNQNVVSCNYWESGKLSDTVTVKHQLAKFNVHCCKTLTEPCLQPIELHSHIPHTKSNISTYLFYIIMKYCRSGVTRHETESKVVSRPIANLFIHPVGTYHTSHLLCSHHGAGFVCEKFICK